MQGETCRPCRVFIVDDHPAVREGLTLLLQQRQILVCGDAEDAEQTLSRLASARPDVVLVDLSLRVENGLSLIEELASRSLAVVVYSMYEDALHIKRAFAAGAKGYVTKREDADILVQGIHEVIGGHRYLSERTRSALIDGNPDKDGAEFRRLQLSDREALVLQYLGEGDSGDEIAHKLHISSRTIETYCSRIMEKLGLAGMKELRRYAIQQGREGLDWGGRPPLPSSESK